jgi:hypothetical protein
VTDPDPTRTALAASSSAPTKPRRTGADAPLGDKTPAPLENLPPSIKKKLPPSLQNLPPSLQDLLGGVLEQAPSVQTPTPAPPQAQQPDTAPDQPLGDLLDYLLTP